MFCRNCGREVPDGTGPLCAECAAAQGVQAPVQASVKKKKKKRLIAIIVSVVAVLVIAAGITVYALLSRVTPAARLFGGFGKLFDTGEQYTFLSLIGNLGDEFRLSGARGETELQLTGDIPDSMPFAVNATLRNSGDALCLSFGARADTAELAPSSVYLDREQLAFSLLDSGRWYGLLLEDVDQSISGGRIDSVSEYVDKLFDLLNPTEKDRKESEKLRSELVKELYKALPDDSIERERVEFNGKKRTAYTLTLTGNEACRFLGDALIGIAHNKTIADFLVDMLDSAGELFFIRTPEGSERVNSQEDLEEFAEEAAEMLEDSEPFGSLELSVYYDGKTPVGASLRMRDVGRVKRGEVSYAVETGKKRTVRTLALDLRGTGDMRSILTVEGTWSGSRDACTDEVYVDFTKGEDTFDGHLTLTHSVEDGVTVDVVSGGLMNDSELRHELDGEPERGAAFRSTLTLTRTRGGRTGSVELQLRREPKTDMPDFDALILTDGSEELYDEARMEQMQEEIEALLPEAEDFLRESGIGVPWEHGAEDPEELIYDYWDAFVDADEDAMLRLYPQELIDYYQEQTGNATWRFLRDMDTLYDDYGSWPDFWDFDSYYVQRDEDLAYSRDYFASMGIDLEGAMTFYVDVTLDDIDNILAFGLLQIDGRWYLMSVEMYYVD